MSNKWLVKGIIALFVPLQIWFLVVMIHFPYNHFAVRETDGKWVVTELVPKEQAQKKGLQLGDVILDVNGIPTEQYWTVRRWNAVDQSRTLLVSRDGQTFQLDMRASHTISDTDISFMIGELFCLFVAGSLYLWKNRSLSARYLSLVFFVMGTTCMSLGASIRGDPLGKFVIGISLILIPVALLHFLVVLLRENGNIIMNRLMKYPYIFVVFISLAQLSYSINSQSFVFLYHLISSLELILFSIGIFFDISFLIYVYFRYGRDHQYVSTMIKTIGLSFTVSIFPLVCFSFIPQILTGSEWIDSMYTSWAAVLFPLSLTYLIASKKIYDIDLVVRRFMLSIAMAIVPSILVVAIISSLFPVKAKTEHLVIAFVCTVIMFSITLYSLEYLTAKLERIVFPRRHYLQTSLRGIAKKLGLISSMRELKDLILTDIVENVQVSGGALVNQYSDYTEVLTEGDIDDDEAQKAVQDEGSPDMGYSCFEIARNEEYVCTLVLTPKKSNTLFGSEETKWLNLIVSYLAVCMENLHLIRKLTLRMEQLATHLPNEGATNEFSWFRKLMFELQEKERSRIATDLHDTTMQDLFFLKRKLAALLDQYTFSLEDTKRFNGILEYIDVINMNLRQSCFELYPYLLQEVGLVGSVEKLIDLEKMTAPFEIEFSAMGTARIEGCDMESKRHLFRVVQELLNNAKKHSQASRVSFRLSAVSSSVALSYEDDGIGFDRERVQVREIGRPQIGLDQMKSRILSLGGQFELVSGVGKGMKFEAVLPLKEGKTA